MDRTLHAERIAPDGRKPLHLARLADLPDGAMIAEEREAWLVFRGQIRAWSSFGYTGKRKLRASSTVEVLTPPSMIRVLEAGYEPGIHPTANWL
jgi:hypothetical protein